MDHPRKFEDKVVNEKLAVFTFDDKITEPSLRKYFVKNWNDLTVEMNKSTILFMGGIHGKETGEFGAAVDIQTLKNQVRNTGYFFVSQIYSIQVI